MNDPELAAIATICSILNQLDRDTRRRVLEYLFDRYRSHLSPAPVRHESAGPG